jgi:hypothetical protein
MQEYYFDRCTLCISLLLILSPPFIPLIQIPTFAIKTKIWKKVGQFEKKWAKTPEFLGKKKDTPPFWKKIL